MPKLKEQYDLLPLLHKFINEIKKGKHLQKNGKKIKSSSIRNYQYLEILLVKFSNEKSFHLRFKINSSSNQKKFNDEKLYWKNFYISFTNYLYDELDHHDNYVGRVIKLLRSFFNYLINEKGLNIGFFHRKFYTPSEDVDIVVLTPERLNELIYNKEKEKQLTRDLKKVKDVFLFGCSVALRFSDLMKLERKNIEIVNDRVYIKIRSIKTDTYTKVKLPQYAIDILNKFAKVQKVRLLPKFNKVYINKKLKVIMEHYGYTEPIERTRQKRGIAVPIYKDKDRKTPLRFCDAVTTHTMRRSAITTLLSLGMNEQMVRQISGHAAGSKEFYRYVSHAQSYIDNEIDHVHKKMNEKKLEMAL
jgi:integrase